MARVVPRTTLPFQRTKATKATNTIKKGLKENKSFDFIFHDVKQIALISSRKPAI
jgi:predicted O-methyltransferase YrrM